MRQLVLLAALASLLLVGCSSGNLSNLDGTNWTFFGYDIGGGVVDVIPSTEPTIAFEGDTVSGSDGCNDFTGSYEISPGNMIEIGPLASTLKACEADVMAQADVILNIVSNAFLYEKTSDGQLIMRTQEARFAGYNEFQPPS